MCIVVGIWLAVETIIGFLLSLFFLCILIDWLSAQGNLSGDVWIVWNGCWWIEGLGRKWGLRTGMDDPHVLGWGCFPFLPLFHGHWSFVSPLTNYYWWDWFSLLVSQCPCHPLPLVPLLSSSRSEPLRKLSLSLIPWLLSSQRPWLSCCPIETFAAPLQVIGLIAIGLAVYSFCGVFI